MKTQTKTMFAILTAGFVAVGSADAATISWGSATAVSTGIGNSSDVSTNGTLVEAYNGATTGGNPGVVVVNGVSFVSTQNLLDLDTAGANDFSAATNSGDATYDALLSSVDFGGGTATTIVIGDGDGDTTTNGAGLLSINSLYEIQVWFVDDRAASDDRVMDYASSNSDIQVALNDQYAIGTFTADGTTQTLYLETNGFGNAHINAYQIRLIPEPSSLALLGLGGLMLARRRRK